MRGEGLGVRGEVVGRVAALLVLPEQELQIRVAEVVVDMLLAQLPVLLAAQASSSSPTLAHSNSAVV